MDIPESFSPKEQEFTQPGPRVSELYAVYDSITEKSRTSFSKLKEKRTENKDKDVGGIAGELNNTGL